MVPEGRYLTRQQLPILSCTHPDSKNTVEPIKLLPIPKAEFDQYLSIATDSARPRTDIKSKQMAKFLLGEVTSSFPDYRRAGSASGEALEYMGQSSWCSNPSALAACARHEYQRLSASRCAAKLWCDICTETGLQILICFTAFFRRPLQLRLVRMVSALNAWLHVDADALGSLANRAKTSLISLHPISYGCRELRD